MGGHWCALIRDQIIATVTHYGSIHNSHLASTILLSFSSPSTFGNTADPVSVLIYLFFFILTAETETNTANSPPLPVYSGTCE